MAELPLISVIVPVFNRAHLVGRSVGSICAQSYRNLDIIVVDDCSTDDIEGAVAALGDARIRLIRRPKNGGAAAARNTGLAEARGKLVAFQDSDDVSLFDRLEREVALLMSLSADHVGVYSAAITHVDTLEADRAKAKARTLPPIERSPLSGHLEQATLEGNFIDMPTMLLRYEAAIAAGPFDERLRNNVDWDYTLRLTRLGPFGFVPQPLYVFSYAPRNAAKNDHVSHNARYSTISYVFITGKLRRSGRGGPYLAKHYVAAGRYLMRLGRPGFARLYFRAALTIRRRQPKVWAHYLISYSTGLYAYAQRLGRAMPSG